MYSYNTYIYKKIKIKKNKLEMSNSLVFYTVKTTFPINPDFLSQRGGGLFGLIFFSLALFETFKLCLC